MNKNGEKLRMEQEILEVLKKHNFINDREFVTEVKIDMSVDELPMVTVTSTIVKDSWRDKIEKALSE